MKRKRNMSLLYLGTPGIKICLPFRLEAMISPSKKQVRFWFGL